jgi:hypothetical protein
VSPELRPEDKDMPLLPWIDPENFNPGYLTRNMHLLPNVATNLNGSIRKITGPKRTSSRPSISMTGFSSTGSRARTGSTALHFRDEATTAPARFRAQSHSRGR